MSEGEGDSYMKPDNPDDELIEDQSSIENVLESAPPPDNLDGTIPDSTHFEPQVIEPAFTPAEMNEILGNGPDSAHELCPHCKRVEGEPEPKDFISIDPNSKWVLVLPDDTDLDMAQLIAERIQKWWDQEEGYDWPIMVIGGSPGLHLVRVDEEEKGPELVDCGAEHCPGHIVSEGVEICLTSEELYCDCEPNCGCEEGQPCDCREPDGDFAGQDYRCHNFGG